jgi:hypothetical protein
MDGDLQYPPEMIPSFVSKWLEGYDVVYGVLEKRNTGLFMSGATTQPLTKQAFILASTTGLLRSAGRNLRNSRH